MIDGIEKQTETSVIWNQEQSNVQTTEPPFHFLTGITQDKALFEPCTIEANFCSTTEAALELYDLGFNIVPLRRGTKRPFGFWKELHTTRLPRSSISKSLVSLDMGVITGRLSRNLFVIDIDDREQGYLLVMKLKKLGLAKWVVETNRGWHIYLLSKDGEVDNYNKGSYYQVRGKNEYVVAPPSVHPEGSLYQWVAREGDLPPVLSEEDLKEVFPELRLRSRQSLPPIAKKVLVNKNISGYKTNSEAEYAAVLSLVRSGRDIWTIISLFEKYNPPHFKERGSKWLYENMILKAMDEIHSTVLEENVDRIIEKAQQLPWSGITGITDKSVFVSCCERAKLEGPANFRASTREVAELAGIETKTARHSLNRLVSAGYLIKKPYKNNTGHFAINFEKFKDQSKNEIHKDNLDIVDPEYYTNSISISHDVWHSKALGKSAREIYTFLLRSGGNLSKNEIVRKTGRSRVTVSNALDRLIKYDLVYCEPLWAANPVDTARLDELAKEFATFGIGEKRKRHHQKEREQRAARIIFGPGG